MATQTVYTQDPAAGRAGGLGDHRLNDRATAFFIGARTSAAGQPTAPADLLPPGTLAIRDDLQSTSQRPVAQLPYGTTADPDGVKLSTASPAGDTTFDGVDLDGVLQLNVSPLLVAAPVTLTLDSNTDWDATTAVLTAVDQDGNEVTENLTIPNDGNVVLTTNGTYVSVVSLFIPAQTGTGGLFELGYAQASAVGAGNILGVTALDSTKEPPNAWEIGNVPTIWERGHEYVEPEDALTAGQQPFVRIIAPGAEQIGAFRSDADGGNAVLVPNCRVEVVNSATLAKLAFDFQH